jgi:ribosomal protein S6
MNDDVMEAENLEATGMVDDGLPAQAGEDAARTGVYELGYHLIPTLAEEDVPEAVSKIMAFLKAENAAFVGERFPAKISLAYPIAKRINGKRNNFESAYFGWVAFEIPREASAKLKALLDQHPSVLRYLIVRTDREAVAAAMSGAVAEIKGDIGKPKRDAETGGELSEAALDQALKTMETEDAKAAE